MPGVDKVVHYGVLGQSALTPYCSVFGSFSYRGCVDDEGGVPGLGLRFTPRQCHGGNAQAGSKGGEISRGPGVTIADRDPIDPAPQRDNGGARCPPAPSMTA